MRIQNQIHTMISIKEQTNKNNHLTYKNMFVKSYISATHIGNYIMNDPLVDWLELYSDTPKQPVSDFVRHIMDQGILFEDKLVNYIDSHIHPVIKVSSQINDESICKSIEYIKQGIPLLHSVPVRDDKSKVQGIIDLLVRSDYVNRLVSKDVLDEHEIVNDEGNLYYIVIDIKFSTISMCADKIHILNSRRIPVYKAQCGIYTEIIGTLQKYTSPISFLMGRRYKYTHKGGHNTVCNSLHTLGRISYNDKDARYISEKNKAIEWLRDVRLNGHTWSINPPSRRELYPNMNIVSDCWCAVKKKVATELGDMTLIWNLTTHHRDKAFENGVYSINDTNCIAKELGIKDTSKTAYLIDSILDINRQHVYNITPTAIKRNDKDVWHTQSTDEVFVDFETLPDILVDFDELPIQKHTDMIFMIGVGYEYNGEWMYKKFICNEPTIEEEHRIMDEFALFLDQQDFTGPLYHWHADESFWKKSICKHYAVDDIPIHWQLHDWVDMLAIFKNKPIIIRGSYNFGLKSIAAAMTHHGMIQANMESECTNGMQAVMDALKCYNELKNPAVSDIMNDITKYNEFDCKTLYQILTYLRNHILV